MDTLILTLIEVAISSSYEYQCKCVKSRMMLLTLLMVVFFTITSNSWSFSLAIYICNLDRMNRWEKMLSWPCYVSFLSQASSWSAVFSRTCLFIGWMASDSQERKLHVKSEWLLLPLKHHLQAYLQLHLLVDQRSKELSYHVAVAWWECCPCRTPRKEYPARR